MHLALSVCMCAGVCSSFCIYGWCVYVYMALVPWPGLGDALKHMKKIVEIHLDFNDLELPLVGIPTV